VARTIFVHTLAFNNDLKGVTPEHLRYSIFSPAADLSFIDDARTRFRQDSSYLDDRPTEEIAMADGREECRKEGLSMVLSLYLRSTLGIIFFQSLDKFGGAFEEPFLRLEDRTRPMRR
jgi:hypothetical protein